MEFCVLDPVEPPQRIERSDGYIRTVYMQGWMTMDHYVVYSDFLANVPEQDLRQLETALGRRVRGSLCSDRHAPWCGLSGIYILPTEVPRIVDYPCLFTGYVYEDRRTRCERRFKSTRLFVCWRPGQEPPRPLDEVVQLRLLLGAADATLPEDPVEGELSLAHVDASSL